MSRDESLEKVGEFDGPLAAHSVRILLEANGIPAVVFGDASNETGLEPVLVYVHKKNIELARRVIEEVPAAAEVLIPAWVCQCGEQVDAGFNMCWSCSEPYREP